MTTPENLVKNKIREDLRRRGAYVFSPVQMGLGSATLDLLCCFCGRFLAIEVKAEHVPNKPTARQHLTMEAIAEAGGATFCCNSFALYREKMRELFPSDYT